MNDSSAEDGNNINEEHPTGDRLNEGIKHNTVEREKEDEEERTEWGREKEISGGYEQENEREKTNKTD